MRTKQVSEWLNDNQTRIFIKENLIDNSWQVLLSKRGVIIEEHMFIDALRAMEKYQDLCSSHKVESIMFPWRDEYSLGHREIDQQHMKMLDMLNELTTFLDGTTDHIRLEALCHDLSDYILYHFAKEEQIMEQIGYPGLRHHKAEHKMIAEKAVEQIMKIKTNLYNIDEFFLFMLSWFNNHLRTADQEITEYIKKSKVN